MEHIEYLMKIGNFNHLKPTQISFVAYYNLDVHFSLFSFIIIAYVLFKKCVKNLGSKKMKTE